MAKNRNKKNKLNGSSPMDVASDNHVTSSALPEAMDTSESAPTKKSLSGTSNIKVKNGVRMKRSKNARKKKAIAKAISEGEKKAEKIVKNESKKQRTKSAKNLYD